MRFQILSWDSSEESYERYLIHMYGRTKEGKSVCVDVEYLPYFYLEESSEVTNKIIELHEEWRLKKYTKVKREKFYGFHNYKQYSFYKLYFKTKKDWINAQYKCKRMLDTEAHKRHKIWTMYESNLDPILKFIHEKDIKTSGWVELSNYKKKKVGYKVDYHLEVNKDDIYSLNVDEVAPFVIASFDIECYSSSGEFPNPEKECPVIQIATKFQRCGESEAYRTHLVSLKSCNEIEGVEVDSYEDEKDVIERWISVLHEEKVDCILGYNIWGFDLWYLWTRAEKVNAEFDLTKSNSECVFKTSHFSSSAYGDNDYKMVLTPGIFQLDLLVHMKREHKLSKYSLNAVSEHFLGEYKVDLSPKEMFRKYEGDAEDRKMIGVYCVQDVNLPLRLINKLAIFTNLIEMAKVTWVPVSYLIERGQGIKVYSQLCYRCKFEKMLIETFLNKGKVSSEDAAYVGATVLTAKTGAYIHEPITGLDFASLYPTIMRAYNLCPSTLALRPDMQYVDDVNYEEIDGYRFVQDRQGVIPKILEELAKSRKQAKKDMANTDDPFMKSVFNGKQIAYKVSMNSIYGGVGSPTFNVPCKPVASCTTSKGREMIEQTKALVEKWYPGSDVVYGDTDSVMVHFPTDSVEESFRLGQEAADRISAIFPKPIELEFEKVYKPYLLFSKKRYAGLMYTDPKKPDYIDAKGIQLVRRDNCPIVRRILKELLDIIMYENDIEKAKMKAIEYVKLLDENKINIDDLVVSKSLKRISYEYDGKGNYKRTKHDYKNPQPHVTVAEKIEKREKGAGPKSGERVPYVFIEVNDPKALQYEKAEDPEYVRHNKLRIDVEYYKTHALLSPIESLMELFYDDVKKEIFDYVEQSKQIDLFEI